MNIKSILSISICLILCFGAFAQNKKLSFFRESRIKIINLNIDTNPNKLPLLTFTIINKTKENIIFNKIALNLIEFKKHPLSSSGNNGLTSKALTPIAGLDLSIPSQPNTYIYDLRSPIEIVSKDAATIQIRVHYDYKNKNVVPSQVGLFKFDLLFLTYDLKAVKSQVITLGD